MKKKEKMFKNAIPKISAPKKQPFTVFIEGNIGAGKTTFLNHFRKYEDVCLHTEPVDKWRNVQGINLLVSNFFFVTTLETHVTKNDKRKCFFLFYFLVLFDYTLVYAVVYTPNS